MFLFRFSRILPLFLLIFCLQKLIQAAEVGPGVPPKDVQYYKNPNSQNKVVGNVSCTTQPSCASPFGGPTTGSCREPNCYACTLDSSLRAEATCPRGFTSLGWSGASYGCESTCANRCVEEAQSQARAAVPGANLLWAPDEIPQFVFDNMHDCFSTCRDPEILSETERCPSGFRYVRGNGAFFGNPRLEEMFRMVAYGCELQVGGEGICTQCGAVSSRGTAPGEALCRSSR